MPQRLHPRCRDMLDQHIRRVDVVRRLRAVLDHRRRFADRYEEVECFSAAAQIVPPPNP